jgi:hypothetical protein
VPQRNNRLASQARAGTEEGKLLIDWRDRVSGLMALPNHDMFVRLLFPTFLGKTLCWLKLNDMPLWQGLTAWADRNMCLDCIVRVNDEATALAGGGGGVGCMETYTTVERLLIFTHIMRCIFSMCVKGGTYILSRIIRERS